MAEIVEQGFAVTDKVAGTIAPKLDQIALASGRAALSEQKLAQAVARTQSVQYAALTSMQRMVTETGRAKVANTNAAISAERLAQAELRTAQAQDRAAQSASRLAAARQRANAANKAGRSSGFLGEAGQAAASGGGVGSAVSGAIGRAAMSNPYVAAGAIGVGAIAGAVATHANYADQYAGLQNSLKNVTGSVETTGIALIELNKIANDTRAPIDAVAEGYARFSRALAPLGKTQQEVMEFQRTLNTMLFQYGKTGSEAASATLQLTQAMGKGKLDGDEFRSVMENLPELGTAIARELGVARGELIALAPQGKITGDVIYNAMLKAKEGLDALPAPVATIGGALTKLSNNATLFFGNLEQGIPVLGTMVGWLDKLGNKLGEVSDRMARHNALKVDLGSEKNVRKFLGIEDDAKLTAEQTIAVRELSSEWRSYQAAREAGVESAENDSIRLLARLEKEKAAYDQRKAAEVGRQSLAEKAAKEDSAIEAIQNRRLGGLKQEIAFGGMKARDAFIARGMAEYQAELDKQGLQLSTEQLKRNEEISKELGRQFDQQQAINGAKKHHLTLLEQIAKANKEMSDTAPSGYASDPTSVTGLSAREDARLRGAIGIGDTGMGNAIGEDFYAESGQLIDLDKAREEMRKKREEASKRTINNDPYLAKKDLDRRTEQLGDYGTDFEFQAKASEELYARIAEMRKLDLLNEQETSNAKMRIWQAEQQNKLGLATTFFDNFIGLQRSENKEVAAIGKAAAIANATITTYQAANAAYAAMAGIPVVGPALGAAAAAAAIASGIVNIQAIAAAPTGFKQGGYTGNMPANDVAGVVHGREYVIDAASTARIGRQNLDALRSGNAAVAPSGGSGGGGPTIVNVAVFGTEEAAMAWLQGKDGEKQIVNAVTKNARTVGRAIKAAS